MQLASKIPDMSVQLWSSALLRGKLGTGLVPKKSGRAPIATSWGLSMGMYANASPRRQTKWKTAWVYKIPLEVQGGSASYWSAALALLSDIPVVFLGWAVRCLGWEGPVKLQHPPVTGARQQLGFSCCCWMTVYDINSWTGDPLERAPLHPPVASILLLLCFSLPAVPIVVNIWLSFT